MELHILDIATKILKQKQPTQELENNLENHGKWSKTQPIIDIPETWNYITHNASRGMAIDQEFLDSDVSCLTPRNASREIFPFEGSGTGNY